MGPVLCTSASNAAPIIEVFRNREYDVHIPWSDVKFALDVGAHVGAFACWLTRMAPDARLMCFEPEPRNFQDLERNVKRNRLTNRVELVHAAVGSTYGVDLLEVPAQRDASSSCVPTTEGALRVKVRKVPLEGVLQRLASPLGVLKMDCEGAEWRILPSLSAGAWRKVQHLLLEFHLLHRYEKDDALAMLEPAGFDNIRCIKTHDGNQRLGRIILLHACRSGT